MMVQDINRRGTYSYNYMRVRANGARGRNIDREELERWPKVHVWELGETMIL